MEPFDNTKSERWFCGESSSSGACENPEGGNLSAEPWHQRYIQAVERYESLDLYSPEAFQAVAKGLIEWAGLLPLRSWRRVGRPAPANKWGLGAERCMTRALHSCLVEQGDAAVAARIGSEMADLLATVESLDLCCTSDTADGYAEKRLIGTARIQAKALAQLLRRLATRGRPKKHRKAAKAGRYIPAADTTLQDRKLLEQWEQARGHGGITRKEFCTKKGISLQNLIRTQDRHRKRLAAES